MATPPTSLKLTCTDHPLFGIKDLGALVASFLEGSFLRKIWLYEQHDDLKFKHKESNKITYSILNSISKEYEIENLDDIFKFFPLVTHLDLSSNNVLTDSHLYSIAAEIKKFCPFITYLNVSGNISISDGGFVALIKSCPQLTTLHRGSLKEISNQGLKALGKECPSLTSTFFSHCTSLIHEGLKSFFEICSAITYVNFAFCTQLAEKELDSIATAPHLQVLELPFCTQITNAWISRFTSKCTQLTSLNLQGCTQITKPGLYAVMEHSPHLKKLIWPNGTCIEGETISFFKKELREST